MKKVISGVFLVGFAMMFISCGNSDEGGVDGIFKKKNAVIDAFNRDATIEEAVIYDKNDVVITVNELTYDNYSAELSFTFENNSEKNLEFIAGSSGYDVNAVNGYMIDGGYMNCEVEAGNTATDTMTLNYDSLNTYGITEIAYIEVGFNIGDDDYNDLYTGVIKIETSIFDSFDCTENNYRKILENGAFENKFNAEIIYDSKNVLYDNLGIKILSETVLNNSSKNPIILFEIENSTEDRIRFYIRNVKVNDCVCYDGLWSSDTINGNNKYIESIEFDNLIDDYEGDIADVDKVSKLTFDFEIKESENRYSDSQTITIELPGIKVPVEEE